MTVNRSETVLHKPGTSSDLPAESAWKLWLRLTDMVDLLWESYQDQFLTFCIRDIDLNKVTSEKLPFK